MISQTADHALRAVLCLAASNGAPLTASQVGDEAGVSGAYLVKIFHTLGRAGIVTAQRGLGGGFLLAFPPEKITLMDVINAIDPSRRPTACPTDDDDPTLCPLHRRLEAAATELERMLHATTVADVLVELKGKSLHSRKLVPQ